MLARFLFVLSIVCFATVLQLGSVAAQGLGLTGDLIQLSNGSSVFQVRAVLPGGLGSQVGLIPGDNIVSINNFPPGDAATNQQAIAMGRGRLTLVVDRQNQMITLGDGNGLGFPNLNPIPNFRPVYPNVSPLYPNVSPLYPNNPNYPLYGPPQNRFPNNRFPNNPGQANAAGPELQVEMQVTPVLGGNRLVVQRVTPGGYGAARGIRAGDVIETVNGFRVSTIAEFIQAYVFQNSRIVLGVLRGGQSGTIMLDQVAQRPINQTLGLRTSASPDGVVSVRGSSPGLGRELGITEHGTVIRSVNGIPIRSRDDLERVDQQIAAGQITQLVIEIIRANGQPDTVRYPQ